MVKIYIFQSDIVQFQTSFEILTIFYCRDMTFTSFLQLLVLALLISGSFCALRFDDEEMLKKHHSEKYPKDGATLTVHLIPHSHDDVGWLKTVDDYYYGGDMRTQFAGVQYTIDTVVQELTDHPEYKFSIVEMAFLYRWWHQATDKEKTRMKTLVANGQLQFINGGWCMSDEANMYYQDFIDQMTVGLRWLKETFNYVPDVAWHIDPFGHHASSASLFSRMGFNSFFFARIDYQDKQARLDSKRMEMLWRPLQYTGDKNTYIFTHVNYYHYSPPPGFCFDDVCRDEPIKDDPTLEDFNIDTRAKMFADYFKSQANHFRTTNLMHTLGEDFQYTNSRMWFKNVDKLLEYINKRSEFGLNIIYSTPSKYIAAIQKEQAKYPVKTDDFFPYADNQHAFWTGYFTSRVALKGFVRDFNRFVQAAKKHISELKISGSSDSVKSNTQAIEDTLFGMEMALGILQHHDAVSGTAKQKVTDDYVATGLRAISAFNKLYSDIKKEEIKKETSESVSDLYINLFWNETGTVTGLTQSLNAGKTVLVSFYNPGSKGTYPVRLRVPPKDLNVLGQDNLPIPGDVVCANLRDTSDCELLFNLAIGESSNAYVKLSASKDGSAKQVTVKELTVVQQIKEFTLGNDKLKFTKGNQSFDLTINGKLQSFKIFYNYYESYDQSGQHSGAYIFRPKSDSPQPYSNINKMYYADGVTTAIVVLDGSRTLTRAYFSKTTDYVRNFGFTIESQLDSIPIDDGVGKEVTLNLKTGLNGNRTFYTDSMGLEEQKRVIDYRPSWNYTVFEPVAGNFYPVNAFLRLQDSASADRMVTVISDRSQGGTVLRQGEIELMIHRRLLVDDSRGVGQPLNETDSDGKGLRQTVRHNVVFNTREYRAVQKWNDQRILPVFGIASSEKFGSVQPRVASLTVPQTVKLFLRPFSDGSYLLRLHNMHPSALYSVSLGSEWTTTELTLAANQLQSEWSAKQLKWNEEASLSESILNRVDRLITDISEDSADKAKGVHLSTEGTATIDLKAFEIRTFKLTKL